MWSVTACGWEIMITCEPSTSVMVAPARSAIERTKLPVAISEVTIAKDPLNATAKGALVGAMLNM